MVLETAERGSGLQVDTATKKAPYKSLPDLSPQDQLQEVLKLGSDRFNFLYDSLPTTGRPTASLERSDGRDFDNADWNRDSVEASTPAVDRYFRRVYPHLVPLAERMYLQIMRSQLQLYAAPDEWWRFDSRPQPLEDSKLVTVPDELAPSTKRRNGARVPDWYDNQIDALERMVSVTVEGIRLGIPILAQTEDDIRPTGEVLLKATSYIAPTTVANYATHGIWEGAFCADYYSNKRKKDASLRDVRSVYPVLKRDSKKRGYELSISRAELSTAIRQGRALMLNEFPYDYTDPREHPEAADLAQLTVINEIRVPRRERNTIIKLTDGLEGECGLRRYKGDSYYLVGSTQAEWDLGNSLGSRAESLVAIELMEQGKVLEARPHIHKALVRLDKTRRKIYEDGYPAELHYKDADGKKVPNNNDLAMDEAMIARASSALSVVLRMAQGMH